MTKKLPPEIETRGRKKKSDNLISTTKLHEKLARLAYAIERKKSMYGETVDIQEEQNTIQNLTRILQERETRLFHNL